MISHAGGWHLTAEGAAVHLDERAAVIADVHLGYEWARGSDGDCVPAHSLAETLAMLTSLLARVQIERLIVAGDLVESARPCPRSAADVERLSRWLGERKVALIAVAGNHDPRRVPPLPASIEVAGWTIGHGHRPLAGPRTISGHHHPVLRAGGVRAPCFLVGPSRIVLPAFSRNAAGCNVVAGSSPPEWAGEPLRCLAGSGEELLDFGLVSELRKRLGIAPR